jgi:hypothetical protein
MGWIFGKMRGSASDRNEILCFHHHILTDSGSTHYLMGIDDRFTRLNWPELEADHVSPFIAVDIFFTLGKHIQGSLFGVMVNLILSFC